MVVILPQKSFNQFISCGRMTTIEKHHMIKNECWIHHKQQSSIIHQQRCCFAMVIILPQKSFNSLISCGRMTTIEKHDEWRRDPSQAAKQFQSSAVVVASSYHTGSRDTRGKKINRYKLKRFQAYFCFISFKSLLVILYTSCLAVSTML